MRLIHPMNPCRFSAHVRALALPVCALALSIASLPLSSLAAPPPPPTASAKLTPSRESAAWSAIAADRMNLVLQKDGATWVHLRARVLGPGWKEAPLGELAQVVDGERRYVQSAIKFGPGGAALDLAYSARRTAPDTLAIEFQATPLAGIQAFRTPTAKASDPLSTFGLCFRPESLAQNAACMLKTDDGKATRLALPPSGLTNHTKIVALELVAASGETLHFAFEPALSVSTDAGEIRLFADQPAEADKPARQRITLTTPAALNFEPENRWVNTDTWFPLKVDNDTSTPSPISLADWQDKPAGKRGFMVMKGDRYEFEDGTPAKLWGVNVINGNADKALVDKWAAALPKYGFNLARLVAFARPNFPKRWSHFVKIQDVNDGSKFDDGALALFDYAFARLKENGVYSGLSPFYGWYPTEADKTRLLAYDELMAIANKGMPASGSFYGVTCIAPDVQNLIIDFHVKLLNHVNPHTGLRYADDPAIAFVELQNEENTFLQLWSLGKMLEQAPTYRKLYYEGFASFLAKRHGSQDALAKAWGAELKPAETLAAANIDPVPAYFAGNARSRRVADQMAYVAQTQRDYYQRFVAAVRKTGYRGGLSGSCWQGINWIGHLQNVQIDREVGQIDRHNYATADLRAPGTGLMSAGLQAVADRPFSYSEWHGGYLVGMHPDMPLVAAYGMGLQGWDLSMGFAFGEPGVRSRSSNSINNTFNDFGVLSQSPVLARMVRRQDVKEGDIVGARRVSLSALDDKADVGFSETFSLLGGANNKRFNGAVPNEAMAAGRVVLDYVDGPVDQPIVDKSAAYIDTTRRTVRSTTGQLLWDYSKDGFFTINTPGTQAAVGFIGGQTFQLDQVTLRSDNPYAHLYVTALEPDKTIANSRRLLVTAIARTIDPGLRFDVFSERPISVDRGRDAEPLLIEPVKATLTLRHVADARVFALDHDGRLPRNAQPLPVERTPEGVRFTVDGERTRAVYYLVELPAR